MERLIYIKSGYDSVMTRGLMDMFEETGRFHVPQIVLSKVKIY